MTGSLSHLLGRLSVKESSLDSLVLSDRDAVDHFQVRIAVHQC